MQCPSCGLEWTADHTCPAKLREPATIATVLCALRAFQEGARCRGDKEGRFAPGDHLCKATDVLTVDEIDDLCEQICSGTTIIERYKRPVRDVRTKACLWGKALRALRAGEGVLRMHRTTD